MNTFQKLEALKEKVKNDEKLKKALLETRNSEDPMASFCQIARDNGVELYLGELFSVGLGIFPKGGEKNLGGFHAKVIEKRQRLVIFFPQKERSCRYAYLHT